MYTINALTRDVFLQNCYADCIDRYRSRFIQNIRFLKYVLRYISYRTRTTHAFIVINSNSLTNCQPSCAEYSPRPLTRISFRTPTRLNRSYRTRVLWLWWARTRWKLCQPSARWMSYLWTPRPTVVCPVDSSASCTIRISCLPVKHATQIHQNIIYKFSKILLQ